MRRLVLSAWLAMMLPAAAPAGVVTGRVSMPDACTPSVSPAVVSLEPSGGPAVAVKGGDASVRLVNQSGLQFVPRVQAMTLGQVVQFTNSDAETHNVHVLTPGQSFNQSMAPGRPADFKPTKPGVLKLVCDIHSHMRGYVVVAKTPFVQVCGRDGAFRIDGVPPGRYTVRVWHEMGDELTATAEVGDGPETALPTYTVTSSAGVAAGAAAIATPDRPWPEVIDRISILLACSRDEAERPAGIGSKVAQRLVHDAYFIEFEASDMEVAVRNHLGVDRYGAIQGRFRDLTRKTRDAAQGLIPHSRLTRLSSELLLELVHASDDLNRRGITSRSKLGAAPVVEAPPPPAATSGQALRAALAADLDRVRVLADSGEADEASLAMSDLYGTSFEPIERVIQLRDPGAVRPLESRFVAIRGTLSRGLRGPALAETLATFRRDVEAEMARGEVSARGGFAPAFTASLVTALREGVEVILLLTMLVSLVAKAGRPEAMAAIRRGVALAVVASIATAVALNRMVAATQGRTRELVEGGVMLAAAAVLFYVSYWLISQSQARRWAEFLKANARRGSEAGGLATLGLTAFLAVYREGAETALMYQAMIGGQGGSAAGLLGIGLGVAVGVVCLGFIYLAIRTTSVRLPLRTFFQVTGYALFAMSVIFAGHAVNELQAAGVLRVRPLSWLGDGLPTLGLYPNAQALGVQGVLLMGAVLAMLATVLDREAPAPAGGPKRIAQPAPGPAVAPPVEAVARS